jgi:hypothetical protein
MLACPTIPTAVIASSSVTAPTSEDVMSGSSFFAQAGGAFTNPSTALSPVSMEVEIVISYERPSTSNIATTTVIGSPESVGPPGYGDTPPGMTSQWSADGGLPDVLPGSQPTVTGVLVGWDYLSPGLRHCDRNLPGELVPPAIRSARTRSLTAFPISGLSLDRN